MDTQDFSRFADIFSGRANGEIIDIFQFLLRHFDNGSLIIPCSMPLMSELMKYDPRQPHIVSNKAKVLNLLCRNYALPYPPLFVAKEIEKTFGISLAPHFKISSSLISKNREWYPDINGAFSEFHELIKDKLMESISKEVIMNRKNRRHVKSLINPTNISKVIDQTAPEFSEKFGIRVSVVRQAFTGLIEGKLSEYQASNLLCREISDPEIFVDIYFKKIDTDDSLPRFMSEFGIHAKTVFDEAANSLRPFLDSYPTKVTACYIQSDLKQQLYEKLLFSIIHPYNQIPYTTIIQEVFNKSSNQTVDSVNFLAELFIEHLRGIIGLRGTNSKTQLSLGGDFIHSLYVPYVDLWRTDAKFAALSRRTGSIVSERIVEDLSSLPSRIERVLQLR